MASNADSLVRDAIAVYRSGKKDEARNLLLQAVDIDERHEQAWLWLSAVVDSVEDQITCLENVLTINPNNEKAQQGLQVLNEKLGSEPPAQPPAATPEPAAPQEDEDPFANVSFTQPASTPAFQDAPADIADEADELPDDSAWSVIETSSPSANRPLNEPNSEVYNEWIAGLNIGSNEATEAFGPIEADEEPAFTASPFIEDDDAEDAMPFEVDRNLFGFEDEDALSASAGPFTTSPFDEAFDEPAAAPSPALSSPPPVQAAPRTVLSPTEPDLLDVDDTFDDEAFDDEDFEDFDDDYDDAELGTVDPNEFFKFIPADIKATRLPGTNERYPALVLISLFLLLLLNVGAVTLVYMTLTGS